MLFINDRELLAMFIKLIINQVIELNLTVQTLKQKMKADHLIEKIKTEQQCSNTLLEYFVCQK